MKSSDQFLISDVAPFFYDLVTCLSQSKNLLPLDSDEFKKMFYWSTFIRSKKASDVISQEDEKQMALDVQLAFGAMSKILNK